MSVASWNAKICDLTKLTEPLELRYLLEYLKSRKSILLDKVGSEEVVMLVSGRTHSKISDVEKGKYDITRTKEILEGQLSSISEKAQQAETRARESLKQGRRNTVIKLNASKIQIIK